MIGNTDGVAAASGDGRRILIDRNDFATMDTLRKRLDEAICSGHTRNTNDPMFIISHELWHIIEKQLGLKTAELSRYPEAGGLMLTKLDSSMFQNQVQMFLRLDVDDNVEFNELMKMFADEGGSRVEDGHSELIAQSFGVVYNGNKDCPLSSAVVDFFKEEMKKYVH